jgi:hypothetical protein
MNTPQGPVELFTNEDSLRDAPRAEIMVKPDRILLLGDSNVEGWWLSQAQTLGAQLNLTYPDTYFINGGLRSTGPLFRLQAFRPLIEIYQPRSVVFILNDTDPTDDKLACATAENITAPPGEWRFSAGEFEQGVWERRFIDIFNNTYPGHLVKMRFHRRRWNELVASERAKLCEPCLGLKEMSRVAKSMKVPLQVIYFKMREGDNTGHYPLDLSGRETYLACLEELKIPFFVLDNGRLSPEEMERYFWPQDTHRNPEGVRYFADQIIPALEDWRIVPEIQGAGEDL